MEIDITSLNYNSVLNIDGDIVIPSEYLENTDIIDLKNTNFKGELIPNGEYYTLTGIINGSMIIKDSISTEEITYDFNSEIEEEIEENSKKSSNLLDITDILWQNIILEVPLKLTNVSNFDEYHGDGWKLVSEDSKEITNNPFKELEEMLREE